MNARSKITAELAAVRMTPERRAEIERLVTQAIDEAVATAVNVEAVANRENDNYLRGYCDGATETAQRVNSAAYSAAKSLADQRGRRPRPYFAPAVRLQSIARPRAGTFSMR